MYPVNIDCYVSNTEGVFFSSELHLQHPLKTPTHEGRIREPRGHWKVKITNRYKLYILNSIFILKLCSTTNTVNSPSHIFSRLITNPPVK